MPISIPMRTKGGLNAREHYQARAKRVRTERECVAWALSALSHAKPTLPCSVLLCRVAPSNGLDDDNLTGALKGVRDEIAKWLGVDDRERNIVRFKYAQRRGPWAVEIEFGEAPTGAQYVLDIEN